MNYGFFGSVLAIAAGLVGIFGNVTAKEWVQKGGTPLFILALFWWSLAGVAFLYALRYGTLTVLNTVAGLVGAVLTVFIGLFYYREQITLIQSIGTIFSLIGMLLLLWPSR